MVGRLAGADTHVTCSGWKTHKSARFQDPSLFPSPNHHRMLVAGCCWRPKVKSITVVEREREKKKRLGEAQSLDMQTNERRLS